MVHTAVRDIVLVGFGHRTRHTALPALAALGTIRVVAIVGPRIEEILAADATALSHDVLSSTLKLETIDSLASLGDSLSTAIAYIAVPHANYQDSVSRLLRIGVKTVIQEKPLATTVEGALFLSSLVTADSNIRLVIAAQRRMSARYNALRDWLPLVGNVRSVYVVDTLNEPNLSAGWRATKSLSGGGVVSDLGYHMLDALVGLFSESGPINVVHSVLLRCRPEEEYDVEDTAHIHLRFGSIKVQMYLSRASASRQELIEVIGEYGVIRLDQTKVELVPTLCPNSPPALSLTTQPETGRVLLARVFRSTTTWNASSEATWDIKRDMQVVKLAESIVSSSSLGSAAGIDEFSHPLSLPVSSLKFRWPLITTAVEDAVSRQLHATISIYDNSGVFATFESEFKQNLNLDVSSTYALLHNSGTNALHALYFALGISKGDKVVVPVYTFHATISPLMQLGAIPVFVDADPDTGNINPAAIKSALERCVIKAVVVTHMWGQPCDMATIVQLCQVSNVLLVEDCSHAHGATINGKAVGTFGDGAAWSLQGEKLISGGEGGISVTRHAEVHYKSLIHGHYNKRCNVEIPKNHPLRAYALTGAGLKNRAHPVAVAIALTQLRLLPEIHASKAAAAAQLIQKVCAAVPFLRAPQTLDGADPSWYVLVFNFDTKFAAPGVTRELYVKEVISRGLLDADMPRSTKPLYGEALYLQPYKIFPGLYTTETYTVEWTPADFAGADKFHETAVKIPVFYQEDQSMRRYAEVMIEAARAIGAGGK